jgi:hypothetical protein
MLRHRGCGPKFVITMDAAGPSHPILAAPLIHLASSPISTLLRAPPWRSAHPLVDLSNAKRLRGSGMLAQGRYRHWLRRNTGRRSPLRSCSEAQFSITGLVVLELFLDHTGHVRHQALTAMAPGLGQPRLEASETGLHLWVLESRVDLLVDLVDAARCTDCARQRVAVSRKPDAAPTRSWPSAATRRLKRSSATPKTQIRRGSAVMR